MLAVHWQIRGHQFAYLHLPQERSFIRPICPADHPLADMAHKPPDDQTRSRKLPAEVMEHQAIGE